MGWVPHPQQEVLAGNRETTKSVQRDGTRRPTAAVHDNGVGVDTAHELAPLHSGPVTERQRGEFKGDQVPRLQGQPRGDVFADNPALAATITVCECVG